MAMRTRVEFQLAHPNVAGIDIGSASHWVAVPVDRDDKPVCEFKSFSGELIRLAEWLGTCEVDTVAMELTGVYWIPLYELLEARGLTVLLVNARHVKNVSGRTLDVLDCQWLQQLMSFGLLSGAEQATYRWLRQRSALGELLDDNYEAMNDQAAVAHRRSALSTPHID